MKYNTLIIGSILLLLLLHTTTIRAQEVEDEREFDYGKRSEKGPKHWGEIKKEWAACKNGEMQSPIDMSHQRVEIISRFGKIKKHYKPSNATLINRGHDISVQWVGDAGSIEVNGIDYRLQQAHWHSPSEHTINARRYDMELHMVHSNFKNQIAVVAVLYKIGKPDPFLSKLMRNISSMVDKTNEKRNAGLMDPNEINISGRRFYRYIGSLTVPPCTEAVIWTIKKKLRTVSRDQIKLLREAVHDYAERKARPLQPLNQRDIHLYTPEEKKNN